MARVIFMGSPDYALPTLDALVKHHHVLAVVTQPDKPVGRKKIPSPPPVKTLALKYGLKVFQPNPVGDIYDALNALNPDFIVTAAFGQFLPEKILNLPKYDALNLHGSLLPKYRGGAPVQRAIMNLEKETGVALMRMVKKMDAGPVFAVKKTSIGEKTTGDLMNELGELAATLIIETLPLIQDNSLKPTPQEETKVTFAPILTREDEKIDMHQSALLIDAKIRALSPSPLAYIDTNAGPVKITQANRSDQKGTPGEIITVTHDGLLVAAKEGSIWFVEGIPAGKKRMKLTDYYRGHPHLRFQSPD